mmetsp:Transcript_28448/g.34708  ORF Transcript_28448/g.34708 Transcript_28448/m.34708 type:complete len:102 (+) Transcript_28448:1175-1480(+)
MPPCRTRRGGSIPGHLKAWDLAPWKFWKLQVMLTARKQCPYSNRNKFRKSAKQNRLLSAPTLSLQLIVVIWNVKRKNTLMTLTKQSIYIAYVLNAPVGKHD